MGQLWVSAGRKGVGMRGTVYLAGAMLAGASGAALLGTPPVAAVDSEMVELQESVKQIIQGQKDTEATLVQTAAVSKTHMEESMNTVNKMIGNAMPMQKTVQDMHADSDTRLDTMSTQIHGISDNLQETRARMGKLNQQLAALQNALRGIDAKLAHIAPPSAGTRAPSPLRVPPKR
jgi:chromosome segregation ATPase